jgi:hypothetical protein
MFWSKSKYPIACALAAIIIFKNLEAQSFIPEYLKKLLIEVIK